MSEYHPSERSFLDDGVRISVDSKFHSDWSQREKMNKKQLHDPNFIPIHQYFLYSSRKSDLFVPKNLPKHQHLNTQ